jgi:hypothetical protein
MFEYFINFIQKIKGIFTTETSDEEKGNFVALATKKPIKK